jgi:hypothetical protein
LFILPGTGCKSDSISYFDFRCRVTKFEEVVEAWEGDNDVKEKVVDIIFFIKKLADQVYRSENKIWLDKNKIWRAWEGKLTQLIARIKDLESDAMMAEEILPELERLKGDILKRLG